MNVIELGLFRKVSFGQMRESHSSSGLHAACSVVGAAVTYAYTLPCTIFLKRHIQTPSHPFLGGLQE